MLVQVEPLRGHWLFQQTKVSLSPLMLAQIVTTECQNKHCSRVVMNQQPETEFISVNQLLIPAAAKKKDAAL